MVVITRAADLAKGSYAMRQLKSCTAMRDCGRGAHVHLRS